MALEPPVTLPRGTSISGAWSVAFDAEKHTELGEIEVREHSEFIGETLRESRLRERWGAIVVAIKHQGGEFILSRSADTVKYKKRKPA